MYNMKCERYIAHRVNKDMYIFMLHFASLSFTINPDIQPKPLRLEMNTQVITRDEPYFWIQIQLYLVWLAYFTVDDN